MPHCTESEFRAKCKFCLPLLTGIPLQRVDDVLNEQN